MLLSDGIVFVSQMADFFVKDPKSVVKVQQRVMVTVLDVDMERSRISLSMKSGEGRLREPSQDLARRQQKGTKRTRRQPDNKPQKKKEKKTSSVPFNNPFTRAFKG